MTTQYAQASYQEIIDLHTETGRVSVLGIHTPVTRTPYDMLSGFFDSFMKYHYDGCSLALVPAARLPADPSQVSYGAGEQPIDPRDMLNPILWHGCHGDSLGSVLNQFYSGRQENTVIFKDVAGSVDVNEPSTNQVGNPSVFESLYYRALTDNTWAKAHPQRGFRKSGLRPLVYSVATDKQYMPQTNGNLAPRLPRNAYNARSPDKNTGLDLPTLAGTMGPTGAGGSETLIAKSAQDLESVSGDTALMNTAAIDNQFFTARLHRLGWMDTRSRIPITATSADEAFTGDEQHDSTVLSNLYANVEYKEMTNIMPRLFMGLCLLPPAYKSEQYFRLVINHRFSFKNFRGISMRGEPIGALGAGAVPNYYNFN